MTLNIGGAVEGYLQWINDYIYDHPTKEICTVISGTYPVFRYNQTSASLSGMDGKVRVTPIAGLDYTFSVGMIWAL